MWSRACCLAILLGMLCRSQGRHCQTPGHTLTQNIMLSLRHVSEFYAMRRQAEAVLNSTFLPQVRMGCEYITISMQTSAPLVGRRWSQSGRTSGKAPTFSASQRGRYSTWQLRAQRHKSWINSVPAMARGRSGVALTLVQDSVSRLFHHFKVYALHFATCLAYAQAYQYDIVLYIASDALPSNMSSMFVKVPGIYTTMFGLRYELVAGLDWDTFVDPNAAVPLSLFIAPWNRATIFWQLERQLCAGVLLFKHHNVTRHLLHEWWEKGLSGHYNQLFHDQSALKRITFEHLWKLTKSNAWRPDIWVNSTTPPRQPPPIAISNYTEVRDLLLRQSHFGFIGLHSALETFERHVLLSSCGNHWPNCPPDNVAALMQHYGHGSIWNEPARYRVSKAVILWVQWLLTLARMGKT